MSKTVVIDCFPESARHYSEAYTIVAVDVIRATTTAITSVNLGRRCFAVPNIEAALPLAARLSDPLLVGELGGNMPYGFHLTNSPAQIATRDYDAKRPMILLSSSGTQLIHNAKNAPALPRMPAQLQRHGRLLGGATSTHRRPRCRHARGVPRGGSVVQRLDCSGADRARLRTGGRKHQRDRRAVG